MKVYMHRHFARWLDNERIATVRLLQAVEELAGGLHDGSLGAGLYKKRIGMWGRGKRGSYRTLIAFRNQYRAFFVYGYTKGEKANVTDKEKQIYRRLAKYLLGLAASEVEALLDDGSLIEVVD